MSDEAVAASADGTPDDALMDTDEDPLAESAPLATAEVEWDVNYSNPADTLDLPTDVADYILRFKRYNDSRENRRAVFARRNYECYVESRRMYYEAYRLIGFVHFHTYDEIKAIIPSYTPGIHVSERKKIVIVVRKIAECCYYLNRLDEGIDLCQRAIEVAADDLRSTTWLAYGVLCKIYTEKGELEKAQEAIDAAEELKTGSGFLYQAKVNLGRARRGNPVDDGPRCVKHGPGADAAKLERIRARNSLESYCYEVKNSLEREVALIRSACDDTIDWLDSHQRERTESYDQRKRELTVRIDDSLRKIVRPGEDVASTQKPSLEVANPPRFEDLDVD